MKNLIVLILGASVLITCKTRSKSRLAAEISANSPSSSRYAADFFAANAETLMLEGLRDQANPGHIAASLRYFQAFPLRNDVELIRRFLANARTIAEQNSGYLHDQMALTLGLQCGKAFSPFEGSFKTDLDAIVGLLKLRKERQDWLAARLSAKSGGQPIAFSTRTEELTGLSGASPMEPSLSLAGTLSQGLLLKPDDNGEVLLQNLMLEYKKANAHAFDVGNGFWGWYAHQQIPSLLLSQLELSESKKAARLRAIVPGDWEQAVLSYQKVHSGLEELKRNTNRHTQVTAEYKAACANQECALTSPDSFADTAEATFVDGIAGINRDHLKYNPEKSIALYAEGWKLVLAQILCPGVKKGESENDAIFLARCVPPSSRTFAPTAALAFLASRKQNFIQFEGNAPKDRISSSAANVLSQMQVIESLSDYVRLAVNTHGFGSATTYGWQHSMMVFSPALGEVIEGIFSPVVLSLSSVPQGTTDGLNLAYLFEGAEYVRFLLLDPKLSEAMASRLPIHMQYALGSATVAAYPLVGSKFYVSEMICRSVTQYEAEEERFPLDRLGAITRSYYAYPIFQREVTNSGVTLDTHLKTLETSIDQFNYECASLGSSAEVEMTSATKDMQRKLSSLKDNFPGNAKLRAELPALSGDKQAYISRGLMYRRSK